MTEAVRWFRLSAGAGFSPAEVALGQLFLSGNGVERNYTEAKALFDRAAEQGNPAAWRMLGLMHDGGLGMPVNDDEAVRLFRLGARLGESGAQYYLGTMYAAGKGVARSDERAYLWLTVSNMQMQAAMTSRALDEARPRLSDTRRAEIEKDAASCRASGFKSCGEPETAVPGTPAR